MSFAYAIFIDIPLRHILGLAAAGGAAASTPCSRGQWWGGGVGWGASSFAAAAVNLPTLPPRVWESLILCRPRPRRLPR